MTNQEEYWKLAQEMLAEKDFSRIKELEELNEQHRKLNGKLREELDFKVDYLGQLLEARTVDKAELEERIDKAIEYIEKNKKEITQDTADLFNEDKKNKLKVGTFMWNVDDLLEILKGEE